MVLNHYLPLKIVGLSVKAIIDGIAKDVTKHEVNPQREHGVYISSHQHQSNINDVIPTMHSHRVPFRTERATFPCSINDFFSNVFFPLIFREKIMFPKMI